MTGGQAPIEADLRPVRHIQLRNTEAVARVAAGQFLTSWQRSLALCARLVLSSSVLMLFSGPSMGSQNDPHPIPDRLIVLTFDDSTKTDITHVVSILKRYRFGASFYVTMVFLKLRGRTTH